MYIVVGSSTKEEDYLKFLFEGAGDFCVIPSFAVIPAFSSQTGMMVGGMPGFQIDLTKVKLELYCKGFFFGMHIFYMKVMFDLFLNV